MPHGGKGGNNPADFWHRLPFELRGDRDFLPEETKDGIAQMRDEEERRLMYVGVTRAKRRVVLSRAWFYRDNLGAKKPSPFWEEALETGLVDRSSEVECPPVNPHPLGIERPPEPERRFEPPPRGSGGDRAARSRAGAPARASRRDALRIAAWQPPSTLSVTAFLTFVRDPEEFFWRYVRRVPSPPAPAAQLGIELHRRIEQWSRGGLAVGAGVGSADVGEEPYDLDASERRGDGRGVSPEQLWENFKASRFAQMKPLMTEQPFTLYLGEGLSVEGRIDAIFEREDGAWDVVDYKTGASDPDPLQLAIYAKAIEEIWAKPTVPAWLLLRTGEERSAPSIEDLEGALGDAARELKELR